MTELTMPRLSDSMEQGTILTWLKADGEQVMEGEDLLEIETDKATVTHPAEASGVLQIIATEGTSLPVGAPIARVGVADGGRTATPNGADRGADRGTRRSGRPSRGTALRPGRVLRLRAPAPEIRPGPSFGRRRSPGGSQRHMGSRWKASPDRDRSAA